MDNEIKSTLKGDINKGRRTLKRGQSSVNVSYSPPSPHTLLPYNLQKNRRSKLPTTSKLTIQVRIFSICISQTYSFNLSRWAFKYGNSLPKCFKGSNPMAATQDIQRAEHQKTRTTFHNLTKNIYTRQCQHRNVIEVQKEFMTKSYIICGYQLNEDRK